MSEVASDILAAGGWLFPPFRLTPALAGVLGDEAVAIAHDDLHPAQRDTWYRAGIGETIVGYFFLADSAAPEELGHTLDPGVFVEVGGSAYFAEGGHTGSDTPLSGIAETGRLYLISVEDFRRIAGEGMPESYMLDTLNRSREDPYRRMCGRLSTRGAQSAYHDVLLRAARAGA